MIIPVLRNAFLLAQAIVKHLTTMAVKYKQLHGTLLLLIDCLGGK